MQKNIEDDLDRLFRRLVVNIRAEYPQYLTSPFPVAEVYQSVVPYRTNRNELGIEMHEDYELALTRLLAGEREYVSGDAAMRQALRSGSSNGSSKISYRNYAASLVEISAEAVTRLDETMRRSGRPITPTVSPVASPRATAPTTILASGPCAFCGGALPDGRRITFCPYCGQNVTVKLCPACSAELEVDWSFCPVCGREVETHAPDLVETDTEG
ncbi:MAG TPA: zinc ribbon domain-containing protein [Gemmatimonadaceae bacterium]|nr:zinc ribbon domain-containing protein [Gemmatimonadaceae bacterium]